MACQTNVQNKESIRLICLIPPVIPLLRDTALQARANAQTSPEELLTVNGA